MKEIIKLNSPYYVGTGFKVPENPLKNGHVTIIQ